MPQHHLPHLLYWWTGRQLPGIQIVNGSVENPWVSSGSPSDKHRIAACFLQHALRRFRSGHITVSDYRYAYRRLYPGNDVPIRLSGVILLSCPAMHRYSGGAAFLGNAGDFHRIDAAVVKALPDFNGYGLMKRSGHGRNNFSCKKRIFHEGGTFSIIYNLGYGAAHIDIQNGKRPFFNSFCHFRHQFRIGAEELKRYRAFFFIDFQKAFRILVFIIYGFGAHHFAAYEAGSHFAAEQTKWQVGYACHWCQKYLVFQSHIANLHFCHLYIPFMRGMTPQNIVPSGCFGIR